MSLPFRIIESSDVASVERLLASRRGNAGSVQRRAAAIVRAVRRGGDRALLRYARQLDGLEDSIEIDRDDIVREAMSVSADISAAIRTAARHIRRVAEKQVPRGWRVGIVRGVTIEQRVTPLARVGCYVPGGRHPLPSSLLMTAIPARVAGVSDVIAVCPRPDAVVLAAAVEAGVTRVFRVGGAHAIAALAYGTESVPKVEKIVGPGNAYVAAAKAIVSAECGIDFHAGPSEILIVATRGRAEWMAADLIAQAEHDVDARAVLLTPSRALAERVVDVIARRLPPEGVAATALLANGGVILTRDLREAIALANRMAPEHLVCQDERVAAAITCAGTTFIGAYAAQAAGDYATGSNHVLPTGGAARLRGGLSAADFVRVSTWQRVTKDGLHRLAPAIMTLAEAEGLVGHAASIRVRQSR